MLNAVITTLVPVSGTDFNPAATFAFALRRVHPRSAAAPYMLAQTAGGILGVWACHAMFGLAIMQSWAIMHRTGSGLWFSEIQAASGLLAVIFGGLRPHPGAVPTLADLCISGA